jgi:excisionase family DNA binding protein
MSGLNLPQLLTPAEAADALRVSVGTLAQWRHHKRYNLPYLKLGTAIRYRAEDIQAFIAHAVAR